MPYQIPVTTDPDQTMSVTIPIDGENVNLDLRFRYNSEHGFWWMTITDPNTDQVLLDSLPIFTGDYPSADLLQQHKYLNLGSIVVVPTGKANTQEPSDENLGIDFLLLWGDTYG